MGRLLVVLLLSALGGCASIPAENADLRTGTDQTPYIALPTYILCTDCKY